MKLAWLLLPFFAGQAFVAAPSCYQVHLETPVPLSRLNEIERSTRAFLESNPQYKGIAVRNTKEKVVGFHVCRQDGVVGDYEDSRIRRLAY